MYISWYLRDNNDNYMQCTTISRAVARKTHNGYNNIIIVCIVHAHVAFNIAYNIIMLNIQPPPPKLLLLLLLHCRRRRLCVHYFGATQPEFLFVYVCVKALDRDTHFTHTTVYYYHYGLYTVFIHLFFFRRRVI